MAYTAGRLLRLLDGRALFHPHIQPTMSQATKASRPSWSDGAKAPLANDASPPAYVDVNLPRTVAPVLLTRKCASLFASLLEPPPRDASQSHLPRTFAPGATVHVLIFPNVKGDPPAKRWKSLTVRLVGTSEIQPYETLTTLHTVVRVHKDVSVEGAKGGGAPIPISSASPRPSFARL